MKAIQTTIAASLADVELLVRAALKEHGFGVLTEMDVAAIFKDKLDIDRSPLKILGACNPDFANSALTIDATVSLLLPCNVVLETVASGTHVAIADPRELMSDAKFAELADEAARQLTAVIATLEKA
ncbi:MAG: DUF302 domain-containing protein [Acidobacteriota bacterium]|nr:DUF302 domain-containing protein [Acidobacteriota bacterium]MDE3043498.1 DUF302 domain-containing protein [Acidobacteriota bacterium]MDE3222964.1 DUF302 domain-containing protein [Acidobacteriota bacterium]